MAESYNRGRTYSIRLARYKRVDGGPVSSSDFNFVATTSETLTGFKNPLHRQQVRLHQSATTQATGLVSEINPGYLELSAQRYDLVSGAWKATNFYQSWGCIADTIYPSPISVPVLGSSVDNDATNRFYKSCLSKVRRARSLVFLGELGETVHLLKHPLRSLVGLLEKREIRLSKSFRRAGIRQMQDLDRLKPITLRRLKNAVADSWLEVQFGIKPLISDVQDFADFLQAKLVESAVEYCKVKGKSIQKSTPSSTQTQLTAGTSNAYVTYNVIQASQVSVRYKGEIKLENPRAGEWSYHDFTSLGADLDEIVPTLWEITPWSFLIDYFTNVGDVIDSFSVPLNSVVWCVRTRRSQATKTYVMKTKFSTPKKSDGFTYYLDPVNVNEVLPADSRSVRFQRDIVTPYSLPRPKISFDLPNGKQVVNIVALAASNSRRLFSHL